MDFFPEPTYITYRDNNKIILQEKCKEGTINRAEVSIHPDHACLILKNINQIPLFSKNFIPVYEEMDKFGGKQILCLDQPLSESDKKVLTDRGFSSEANKESDSFLLETTGNKLNNIKLDNDFSNLSFVTLSELNKINLEEKAISLKPEKIDALINKSGVLKKEQVLHDFDATEAFELLRLDACIHLLKNSEDDIVAFCKTIDLGEGKYYLHDTFLDKDFFSEDNKQAAEMYLYQQIANYFNAKNIPACKEKEIPSFQPSEIRMLLEVPADKKADFEKRYDCTNPTDVMFKISSATQKYQDVIVDLMTTDMSVASQPSPAI